MRGISRNPFSPTEIATTKKVTQKYSEGGFGVQDFTHTGYDVLSPVTTVVPTISSATNINGGVSGVTVNNITIDGEKWLEFTATAQNTTSGTTTSFQLAFNTPLPYPVACDSVIVEMIAPTPVGSPYMLNLGTAGGYTIQANYARWGIGLSNSSDVLGIIGGINGGRTQACFHRTEINRVATGYTGESILQPFDVCKLVVNFASTLTAGTTLKFYLRSITLNVAGRKGRLAIVADDGYASWFQQAVPILERRGLRSTAAIISPYAGVGIGFSNLFTTERALASYVAAGNACVAHGPITVTDNLYSGVLAGGATAELNAARVADMNIARDWLYSRKLTTDTGAKCYVWPQGVWNAGTGEVSLLDAAYAAGYRLARSAGAYPNNNALITTSNYERFTNLRALSPRNHWRLVVPVIGHTYYGTANTPDDPVETAAVNSLINVIQNLAASRMDGFLMLHKVVPKGKATTATEIEVDRLDAIAAACQSLVNSGQLEVVTMPEMVNYD